MPPPRSGTKLCGSLPAGHTRSDHEIDIGEGLTCIHQRIHYTATPDTTEGKDELDQSQIDNFLATLSDVALAVARRKEQIEP